MKTNVIVHVGNLEHDKEVVDRLVSENMQNKLDRYLKKFENDQANGTIDITVERYSGKNENGLFRGTLKASLDGNNFRFSREEFKKLDDLVNHLFTLFKESLSEYNK